MAVDRDMNIGSRRSELIAEHDFERTGSPYEPKRISISDIKEITNYCRDCNLKLKTTAGRNNHTKLGHKIHRLKILKEQQTPFRPNSPIPREYSLYEIHSNIDYSTESELNYGKN